MPDKARFFVWHQGKTIVAFMSCLIEGDELCAEYIGLEYPVALDLHLYFYSFRDVVSWAIANGFKWYRSSALNYDPKFHLKHSLDPLDLYVRHTSKFINPILRRLLPLLEPTRNDKTLPMFSNYADLWARQHTIGCVTSHLRRQARRAPIEGAECCRLDAKIIERREKRAAPPNKWGGWRRNRRSTPLRGSSGCRWTTRSAGPVEFFPDRSRIRWTRSNIFSWFA